MQRTWRETFGTCESTRGAGARARQLLAVVALIALLAITILALAGARRTVLGQEPKACHEVSAPLARSLTRC